MKLHLKVTEEHIKRGIPCSDNACPIALGLKEVLSNMLGSQYHDVYVDYGDNIEFWYKSERLRITGQNQELSDFIDMFDSIENRPQAKPFEADLEFDVIKYYSLVDE